MVTEENADVTPVLYIVSWMPDSAALFFACSATHAAFSAAPPATYVAFSWALPATYYAFSPRLPAT